MEVPDLTSVPLQTQLYITWGFLGVRIGGEFYSAIRNGGGLKRIGQTLWFGENVPKPIAKDYKAELKNPIFKGTGDGTTLPPEVDPLSPDEKPNP